MNINYFVAINSLFTFFLSIKLVKKKKIDFIYSIIFIFECVSIFFMSLNQALMLDFAEELGIEYQNIFMVICMITFNTYFSLYLSYIITTLKKTSSKLVQEIALMQKRLERLELSGGEHGK